MTGVPKHGGKLRVKRGVQNLKVNARAIAREQRDERLCQVEVHGPSCDQETKSQLLKQKKKS